jgi:hypothetical protein
MNPPNIRNGDVAAATAETERRRRERQVDDELAQSFPASDPPSWTMGVTPGDGDSPDDLASGKPAPGASCRDAR